MGYTNNEVVKNWENDSDFRLYEKYLGALCEWEYVDRLDELIVLLDSFVGNKEFEKFFSQYEYGYEGQFQFDLELIPMVHGAYDAMSIFDQMPYFFPSITHHLIIASSIASLFGVVQLNFVHYNDHLLSTEEDKVVVTSGIFYFLTFFVEGYDNPDNEFVEFGYEFYKDFFKRAKRTYWADKKVKKLSDTIRNFRTRIFAPYHFEWEVHNTVYKAAIYLMVCNAFKEGRDSVSCEDVVVGYLTVYKMIFNDMRPFVYSLYDEEKWGEVDKNIAVYKPLDKSPFENI